MRKVWRAKGAERRIAPLPASVALGDREGAADRLQIHKLLGTKGGAVKAEVCTRGNGTDARGGLHRIDGGNDVRHPIGTRAEVQRAEQLPDGRIATRWHGVYAKHPTKSFVTHEPQPGCVIAVAPGGAGMTLSFGIAEEWWEVNG